jgi:hypothetical protein
VNYVLKLVVGPWSKTIKCLRDESVRGALAFGTHEEALTFGKWIADNAERLKSEMQREAEAVEKTSKRSDRS